MQQIKDTLKIVSIQHELAMSIGVDLNLDPMLEHFMQVLQRRLSLASCHIYISPTLQQVPEHSRGLHYLRSPKITKYKKQQCELIDQVFIEGKECVKHQAYCYINKSEQHFYLFAIGELGWLILERYNVAIDSTVLNSLTSIIEKLALNCIACLQHKNLQLEIEHREQVEQTLKKQAYRDPLTGLPNRKMLYQELRKNLSNAHRNGHYGALFYFDVDRFKNINDTLGHIQGDELLVAIGKTVQGMIKPQDCLARVGGDEFVVLLHDLGDHADIAKMLALSFAEKLVHRMQEPISLTKSTVKTSISLGIITFPEVQHKRDLTRKHSEQLVHNAEIAMYEVKSEGRCDYHFYQKCMQEKVDRHAHIEQQLKLAITEDQFTIAYQPLVNKSGHIVAAEALLRWNNNAFGQVSPEEFIPIAEESGDIVAIGEMVIDKVCLTLQQLRRDKVDIRYITVNISPCQFKQANFVEYLLQKTQEYEIPTQCLKLEITEGLAIESLDEVLSKMNRLIRYGFHFLLDDFGSGYSSLSYVHKLPLYAVKIDKSFISNLSQHLEHQVIANAIIDIAERLDIGCIAEGVETMDDVEYLRFKRVTAYQGYQYFRPMPKLELAELLQQQATQPVH